jgi:hypothetical protein
MFSKKRIHFLIIGAQKCGTSSLAEYLKGHPQIEMASPKEVHFFNFKWDKGIRWYHRFFDFKHNRIQGEATPYYMVHPEAAARAKQYNPNLKIIALLRNPVERAYSHYQMNLARNWDTLPFLDALKAEESRLANDPNPHVKHAASQHASYKTRGLYAEQLHAWETAFGRENMLVLNYHTFFQHPTEALQPVFSFLGLAPYFPAEKDLHLNQHPAKEPMPAEARELLNHYFSKPNQRLEQEFGIRF